MNDCAKLFSSESLEYIKENGGRITVRHTEVEVTFNEFPELNEPIEFENNRLEKISVGHIEELNPECMLIDSSTGRDIRSDKQLNLP